VERDGRPGPDLGVRPSLALWDYRRRVTAMYAAARALPPLEAWQWWRRERDRLFATHPQSPIPHDLRSSFEGLPYFAHDPSLRVEAAIEPSAERRVALPHSGDGTTTAFAIGVARFALGGIDLALTLYRLDAYGDGIILPFGDATNGTGTYRGGRYLIDTAKGADLGSGDTTVILDFNFSYHPSCVHDHRWSCPLTPPANRLPVPVEAGERLRDGGG
jgi:uncharacterized protein